MPTTTAQSIGKRYHREFPKSSQRFEQAKVLFPDGVTHDLRRMEPFPIYVDRARGAYKWDIDGHQFIDYWSGHGAMLLGHSHPDVVAAVQEQMARMTHAGGCHVKELEWGQWVQRLIPSAERVRFVGSGTEATLMGLRLARMYTGRSKILKFAGHFHGWHDAVVPGADGLPTSSAPAGVLEDVATRTVVIKPNDVELLERTLASDPDIAAVILEPTGGHWGAVPIGGEFLRALRELTQKHGQVLIFDEVITGFRVSPGGAQAYYRVIPDLTSMAKIVAGGLPGGCLGGRADILAGIETRAGQPKMMHPGTFNANPLSAAAGITVLSLVSTGEPCRRANQLGRLLRNRLNAAFRERNLPWIAYGSFSMFKLIEDYTGPRPSEDAQGDDDGFVPYDGAIEKLEAPKKPGVVSAFKQAMLLHGVDMPGFGGWLTAAHTEEDVRQTVEAVVDSAELLHSEGTTD